MASSACTIPRSTTAANDTSMSSPILPTQNRLQHTGPLAIEKLPPWHLIEKALTEDQPKQHVSPRKCLERIVLDLFPLDIAQTITFHDHNDKSTLNYPLQPKLFRDKPERRLQLLQMLLSIVQDLLYCQQGGYMLATPAWVEVMRASAAGLLREPKVPVHQFMLVCGEALMHICRAFLRDDGLANSQNVIFELSERLEGMTLKARTYKMSPLRLSADFFVPRSMQFIRELRRKSTFQAVILKVAGEYLPTELTDLILAFIAADDPMLSKGSSFKSAWGAFPQELLNESGRKSKDRTCCTLKDESTEYGPDIFLWSLEEYRYVRYHGCSRPRFRPVSLSRGDDVYVRCDDPTRNIVTRGRSGYEALPLDERIWFKRSEIEMLMLSWDIEFIERPMRTVS